MITVGTPLPPKVYVDGGLVVVEGDAMENTYYASHVSPQGRALLELIAWRDSCVVGVASGVAPEPDPSLRAIAGLLIGARNDVADAVASCATQEAAEALTTALAHVNAAVRACCVAAEQEAES